VTVRRGRRLRVVLPFAVVLALVLTTWIAHAVQQPDPTAPSFLSPTSDAGDGARTLVQRLTAAGVQVDRRATTPEAIAAATAGDATLMVTAPGLVHPDYLSEITSAGTRVVLVAPDDEALANAGLYLPLAGPRWTAAAPEPGCAEPFATAPAAVLRWAYGEIPGQVFHCYSGGVVEMSTGDATVTLVGASDPFRNDRLDEHGNAAFAVGLLSRASRVVWLDLHAREVPPPTPEPTIRTFEPEPAEPGEGEDGPARPQDDEEPFDEGGDERGDGAPQSGQSPPNPLAEAFPPAFWAIVLLLALAALALAAASARRLGTPVAEPLPSRVRAAETVRGLGGLYRRARARAASLETVQAAACRRLAVHFGLPPDSTLQAVAARVAAETGQPEHEVRALLGGGVEDTDEELATKAAAVQHLVRTVTGHQAIIEGTVT
jgi:hypothetical protein